MKAKNLEKMFDEGKDVTPHLDLSKIRRPGHEQRRVNANFPNWIIDPWTLRQAGLVSRGNQ